MEKQQESYLDNYRDFILDLLRLSPQIRQTNIYYKLQETFPEFEIKRVTFYRYIKKLREANGLIQFTKRATGIREQLPKGEEAQVDFGQYKMKTMYGTNTKVYFFCMVLSHSNMRFVYFESQPFTTATAVKAHEYAFQFFGGRTRQIMYDLPSSFYRYMVKLREIEGFVKNGTRLFAARDESPPGYEAQADLGQMKLKDMYGNEVKVYFFCMVLSYSRMKFAFFGAEPFDTNRLIYAHEKAFKYFGGRPEIIMYDQDRLLLVNENAGNPVYTKAFDAYRERVGFKAFLCRKNDPDTKGKIENVVGYIKSNFLDSRQYTGIDSLKSACLAWLDRTGNGTVNAATKKIPREMFELERLKLAEYKVQNVELTKQKIVTVSDVNTITYRKSRYSLPAGMHVQGDRLCVEDDGEFISIIDPVRNTAVVRHKLAENEGRIIKTASPPKPQNPIVNKVKKLFDDDPEAVRFIDEICEEKPRYIIQQCRLLKKIHTQYGLKEGLSAIGECMAKGLFDATEVLTVWFKDTALRRLRKYCLQERKRTIAAS